MCRSWECLLLIHANKWSALFGNVVWKCAQSVGWHVLAFNLLWDSAKSHDCLPLPGDLFLQNRFAQKKYETQQESTTFCHSYPVSQYLDAPFCWWVLSTGEIEGPSNSGPAGSLGRHPGRPSNQRIHPRSKYAVEEPDFEHLAQLYPRFRDFVFQDQGESSVGLKWPSLSQYCAVSFFLRKCDLL